MKKKEENSVFNDFPEFENVDVETCEGDFFKNVLEQLYAKAGARFMSEEDEKNFVEALEHYGYKQWRNGYNNG